jgi:outer membrane protein TolC
MPTELAGHRHDRVERARDLSARAQSVVVKTRLLITLEAEDAFAKWREASLKSKNFAQRGGKSTKEVVDTTKSSWEIGGTSTDDLLKAQGLADQFQAEQNEALYDYALSLAALERITAGGYVPLYRRAVPPQPAP